jgi:hypothetical protein
MWAGFGAPVPRTRASQGILDRSITFLPFAV